MRVCGHMHTLFTKTKGSYLHHEQRFTVHTYAVQTATIRCMCIKKYKYDCDFLVCLYIIVLKMILKPMFHAYLYIQTCRPACMNTLAKCLLIICLIIHEICVNVHEICMKLCLRIPEI